MMVVVNIKDEIMQEVRNHIQSKRTPFSSQKEFIHHAILSRIELDTTPKKYRNPRFTLNLKNNGGLAKRDILLIGAVIAVTVLVNTIINLMVVP